MKYIWIILGTIVLLSLALYVGYSHGYTKGSDEQKLEYLSQRDEYVKSYLEQKKEYERQISYLEDTILQENKTYYEELNNINRSFADRLSESEQRATYYKQLAQQAGSGCSLSTHTAKLDRALTEGVQLVRELSKHIELRDSQLKRVGEYLETENILHD